MEWTAPEAPEFVRDGMSINDIKQNAIGDCWFLASLSSLASRRERISFVIQKRRNETANPETGYEFKVSIPTFINFIDNVLYLSFTKWENGLYLKVSKHYTCRLYITSSPFATKNLISFV